jgi:hypothetical protein
VKRRRFGSSYTSLSSIGQFRLPWLRKGRPPVLTFRNRAMGVAYMRNERADRARSLAAAAVAASPSGIRSRPGRHQRLGAMP